MLLSALLAMGCGNGDGNGNGGQGGDAPTATHTSTPQHTATATTGASQPTATVPTVDTPSPAATSVPSATRTPVASATSTASATAVATATAPSPPTQTATASPSASPTAPPATPTPSATNTATSVPTATQGPGYVVRSSIEQLLISDAAPGTEMAVRNAAGTVLQNGYVDAQGTLIFRDLPPGDGYVVFVVSGGSEQEAHPAAVWSMHQTPANDFYTTQRVDVGYQYITTRDGTKLGVNVYLPGPAAEGPYPTVIEYSGYDPANPEAPQPGTLIATALGYAAVGINMRGTGCSGGSFKFFEPAQVTDGYDAVEIIAQQPWVKFNKVGMVGVSYPGISQLFVAQLQPPHLAAIAPLSIISDTARGILYPGGILNNGFATDWAIERQQQAEPFGQPWAAKRRDQGDQICIENQRFRGQNPDLVDLINANRYYYPEVADRLGPFTFVDKINVPVYLAGAWQDEQTGGYFPTMLERFTGSDKLHFTMTNGGHTDSLGPAIFSRWTEFLSFYVRREIPVFPGIARLALSVIGQQVFGVERLRVEPDRFTGEPSFEAALAKFEAEPKVRILFENGGHPDSVAGAPIAHFERSFSDWPPPGLQPTAWYLDADGHLSPDVPNDAGADSYQYDTARSQLTTIVGGDDTIWKALPNWNWRQPAAGKAAVYESDTLEETLVMLGSGSVDLWLESTADDTDLQVTLSEVRPDGKETYVQSGWLRASHRALDPEANELRPVHTHREDDAAPLPHGEVTEVRVEIFPFAHVFRAGSRLRLIIDSPGATRPRWKFDVLKPDGAVINTIHRSPSAPSRVVLPVLPGVDPPGELPRCPSLRLQYCRNHQTYQNTAAP